MRLLLDECVDQSLRLHFAPHECFSARYAGLAGLKNGVLLAAAEAANFDVLVTTDQEIPYQQNFTGRRISVVILCGVTNRFADLVRLVPEAIAVIEALPAGCVVRVGRRD